MSSAQGSRPFLTPGASPFRHAVERRSAVALFFIRSLPRSLPPLIVVALLAGGVLLDGPVAAACLAAVAALFGWLLFLSWPALQSAARAMRLVVLVLMVIGVVVTAAR